MCRHKKKNILNFKTALNLIVTLITPFDRLNRPTLYNCVVQEED